MVVPVPDYEWTLCYSPSTLRPFDPLEKIGTLHSATARQFQITRNRAGSASFTIRTNDDAAYAILDGVDMNDIRGTVRKCITIKRNGRVLWSGPIWGINGSLDQGSLQITCVGWLETIQHRVLWNYADYSNSGYGTPGDQIAYSLLDVVNRQDLTHPLLIQPGTVHGVMQVRNRAYQIGQNLGAAIQELSDIEAGFDYTIDPINRAMDLWAWDSYLTRENVVLGYNWGPNNLKDFGWQESADKMCNYMGVISQGAPVFAVDSQSEDTYGVFEEYNSITGANQDVLAPYANAELAVRSRPLLTYTVQPHLRAQNLEGPALFDDYDVGDAIFTTARKHAFRLKNQKVRVFGATVSLDDNSNETVSSLQFAPTGS